MTREMKNSGVEWIGDIPSEWKIRKIKNVCSIYTGNSIKDNEKNNFTDSTNAIPYIATKEIDVSSSKINYDNGMYIKRDDENFKVAPKKSTLMCIEGGSAGKKIAYLNQEVCFVNKLCCFSAKSLDDKFLYYYLKSPSFNSEFELHISGLIGGVSQGELREFAIPVPPLPEQEKISDFLDSRVNEIDKIISETKASIENYKEYKQSVITEAVTKGLDKNVPMKDSGIEWIGEIPCEWKVSKIKYVSIFSPSCDISALNEDSEITYTPMEFIKSGYFINNITSLGNIASSLNVYQDGDIVMAKVTPCFENGNIAIMGQLASGFGFGSSELFVLRPIDIETKYMFYWLRNILFVKRATATMTGTGGLKRVSSYFLKNDAILLPTLDEQNIIAKYLDNKCAEIDNIILEKEKLITNLEEYKKSLIYEYVTGKKAVE